MLCVKCPRRDACVAICQKLEAHLKSREGYQREICLDHEDLALVAEAVKTTWQDLLPDYPWLWGRIAPQLESLPAPLLKVFVLHFYEGKTIAEISRSLHIHRVTVNRRLRRALDIIKRGMARRDRESAVRPERC
jgi:DNA-directed RNA polymerase specialized sigma24 family protein